jgi:hypothetical protein
MPSEGSGEVPDSGPLRSCLGVNTKWVQPFRTDHGRHGKRRTLCGAEPGRRNFGLSISF